MPRRFRITDDHLRAFSAQQRERFEDEMAVYLAREYPQETADLGNDGLYELIQGGIDKARTYNIVLERDVARYIEFMVILGPDFDTSDETSWAQAILKKRWATGQSKLDSIAELAFDDD